RHAGGDREVPVGMHAPVPAPEALQFPADRGERWRGKPPALEVERGLIPEVAHGGEAVADPRDALAFAGALGHAMAERDDQIVAAEVEPADRPGKKRQEPAVAPPRRGPACHPAEARRGADG